MNFPGQPPLTTHVTGKVCFDEYGNKRSNLYTETQDVADFKVSRNLQTLYLDNYKYSIDLDAKKGTEEVINDRIDKITNYDNPDDSDKSLYSFTLTGAGTFLDKPQFQKSGALHPEYGLFVTEQRAIAARQCMKRAPNSRATADRVILL